MNASRRKLLGALAGLATLQLSGQVAAQTAWPSRPIKLVTPFPAGGSSDNVTRLIAEKMALDLNVPVVVDNKAGGTTQVGTDFVARADPDGYTLLLGASLAFVLLPHLRTKLPYDPKTSFNALGGVAEYIAVVAARKDMDVATLADFIRLAKANPDKYTYGSAGLSSFGHVAGEILKRETGIKLLHVPFKGSADAATALAGGQIDLLIDGTTVQMAKAGRVVPLATFSRMRHAELPNLPTMAEAGFPVKIPSGASWGLFSPKGTPAAINARLSQFLEKTLADPEVRTRLIKMSTVQLWQPPAEYRQALDGDYAFYGELLPSIGLRPEN